MAAFDELQPTSFNDIAFAISSLTITGGLRKHTHEYPHANGGDQEKLGRLLYVFEMDAIFSTRARK